MWGRLSREQIIRCCLVWLGLGLLAVFGGCDCENAQRGQLPKIQVEPKAVVFAVIGVGNEKSQVVRVSNIGNAVLDISTIQIDPGGDKSYQLFNVPKTPTSLKPGDSIKLSVKFKPTAAGRPESTLWIDSNDPDQGRTIIPLRTVGNAPRIQVKPLNVDFGFVDAKQTKTKSVQVTNVGSADLHLKKLFITAADKDFSVVEQGGAWPMVLKPQKSIAIKVAYRPSNPGADIGELWIESDDPNKAKQRVVLQGQRSEPNISVNPIVLDFGGVAPKKTRNLPLIISNRGGATLTVSNIVKEAGSSAEFSFIVPSLPVQIPSGQSMTIATFYSPKDKGTDNGVILIESDDPDSPKIKVNMVGQSPSAGIEVSPLLLDFGKLPQGASRTKAVSIVNKGSIPIQLKALPIKSAAQVFKINVPPKLPHTLNPNGFLVLKVTYAPQSNNSYQGTLEVQSSDPVSPMIPVKLLGTVVPAPPCFLQGKPSLVNFQNVALGKSVQKTVLVTNIGSGTCWLFEAGLAPSTHLDFSLASGAITLPIALGAGQKYSLRVAYSPQRPGPANGILQVKYGLGLLSRSPPLQVALSAIGAGPRLCIFPKAVDFGAVTKGSKKTESFRIVSCGTDPVTISSLALATGTSSEYKITKGASLPLVLAINKDVTVTVEYAPKDIGFDLGRVAISSNAAGASQQFVFLRGYGVNKGQTCGALRGRICAPDGQTWLTGAVVSVRLPSGKSIQATTDIDGYFYLPCIPPGRHKFSVRKGAFSTDFTATIVTATTNTLKNPKCVDPSRTKIAVVWGEYDEVQNILDRLKLSYTFFQNNPASLLSSLSKMKKFNIIFLNCGMDESVFGSKEINNLRQFVKGGGSLYASDFSYDPIEMAWPNAVDWLGNDSTRNAAEKVGSAKVPATVLNTTLINRLGGRKKVTIKYDLCPCAAAVAAGAGTNTLLRGDRTNKGNSKEPLAVFFKPYAKGGTVVYTTFHNDEQFSRTIDIILKFLIFEL